MTVRRFALSRDVADMRRLLLEHQASVAMLPAHAREERHAEQVLAERLVGQHERLDVAYRERADVDAVELDWRRAHDAVGGRDARRVLALRRMDAEPRGVAL